MNTPDPFAAHYYGFAPWDPTPPSCDVCGFTHGLQTDGEEWLCAAHVHALPDEEAERFAEPGRFCDMLEADFYARQEQSA